MNLNLKPASLSSFPSLTSVCQIFATSAVCWVTYRNSMDDDMKRTLLIQAMILHTEHGSRTPCPSGLRPGMIRIPHMVCTNAKSAGSPIGLRCSSTAAALPVGWSFVWNHRVPNKIKVEDEELWLQQACHDLASTQADLFLVVCWMLWKNRNKRLTEGFGRSAMEVVNSHWQPPLHGVVKINFDGAVFANRKELGVGVIARNSAEACLAWRKRIHQFSTDPMVAETLALLEAAKMGLSQGWNRVILEGDCQIIISRIATGDEDLSLLGPIIEDIRRSLELFVDKQLQFVPRDLNAHAYQLARAATTNEDG
ncbi:hypothetical protein Salat_0900100 [Sesamum alatum]|uniref:RNase H type-1 domain-containing protein n=1 Tax=Sesamum alatum TaxID=300844 RepID=A0AAE1YJF9_9LAMI|nr:hypothetical protein Salat_0900100 [Sesamum alatum]